VESGSEDREWRAKREFIICVCVCVCVSVDENDDADDEDAAEEGEGGEAKVSFAVKP